VIALVSPEVARRRRSPGLGIKAWRLPVGILKLPEGWTWEPLSNIPRRMLRKVS
jgi:hypothetical protein